VSIVHPLKSGEEHELILRAATEILSSLGFKYRVHLLTSGAMGVSAAKCFDLEVYSEVQKEWIEISSISNCTDYQARRAQIRYKLNKERGFVHTLNGSGVAVGRALMLILENFQDNGEVWLPPVLWPYLGGIRKISFAQGTNAN